MDDRTERIRDLNDVLRVTMSPEHGRVMLTQQVAGLPPVQRMKLLAAIVGFKSFTEDNDPYGEHDFGSVVQDGETYFWKIDYYDKQNPDYGSEYPESADHTARVMTIMHSSEY